MSSLPVIPLARPPISAEADLPAIDRVLRSGRLSQGPETERFEERLAELTGRRAAVAVSSGTTALELSFAALGLAAGDRVLIPAFGFPAAVHAVLARGAVPVPVDAEEGHWTVDLRDAERVAAGARFLVSIDALGLSVEQNAVQAFADAHGLMWINDAACGLGAVDSTGRVAASGGALATLSFHPRKLLTTGEGGAVVGDDAEALAAVRELRNLGQLGRGRFGRVGTNARLSEIASALGASQCPRLPAMVRERGMLADGYRRRLAPLVDSGRLSLQKSRDRAVHAYQTFAVLLGESIDRQTVIDALADAGVESGPATYAFHEVPVLASAGPPRDLPVASALHHRSLALPLYLGMRSAELDRVSDALEKALS